MRTKHAGICWSLVKNSQMSNVGSDNLPLLTRGGGVEEFAEADVVAPVGNTAPGVSSPLFVGSKKLFHCFLGGRVIAIADVIANAFISS